MPWIYARDSRGQNAERVKVIDSEEQELSVQKTTAVAFCPCGLKRTAVVIELRNQLSSLCTVLVRKANPIITQRGHHEWPTVWRAVFNALTWMGARSSSLERGSIVSEFTTLRRHSWARWRGSVQGTHCSPLGWERDEGTGAHSPSGRPFPFLSPELRYVRFARNQISGQTENKILGQEWISKEVAKNSKSFFGTLASTG